MAALAIVVGLAASVLFRRRDVESALPRRCARGSVPGSEITRP
jgi:hypothetical protein